MRSDGTGVRWQWKSAAGRGLRTLRLETRSAVSSRVNWLIWSTMVEILGLTAAASVELYLRVMRCCWRRELEARMGALLLARSWRAQHCAAYLQDIDMAGGRVAEKLGAAGIGLLRRRVRIGLAMGCCGVVNPRDFFGRRSKSLPVLRVIGRCAQVAGSWSIVNPGVHWCSVWDVFDRGVAQRTWPLSGLHAAGLAAHPLQSPAGAGDCPTLN